MSVLTGDTAGAQRWAAFVDAASFDGLPVDGSASFESARAMLRAAMCATGPEQMMADAAFAVAQEPEWSHWRDTALWGLAEAHLLAGHRDEGRGILIEASTAATVTRHAESVVCCESELALLAIDRGDWQEATGRLERALATIDENRLDDYYSSLLAFAGAARLALHQGDLTGAQRQLTRAMRARPSVTYVLPTLAVRLRLELAKVYLALADVATVRQLLREIADILRHRPALGTLVGEVEEFRQGLIAVAATGAADRPPLTPAELRLLPYLQTHLTAEQIADRLFVSTPTVKTHLTSVYRKLGVSRRNDAVQKATTLGLLGA
jgi:LuxR family maltose regulon positive regulatory protein